MKDRGHKRNFGRGKPLIPLRRTIYIICEGEKTEYSYLKAIWSQCKLKTVTIDIDPGSRAGSDPKRLLEYAKAKKNGGDYDDVWCVFDDDGRHDIDVVLRNARKKPKVDVAFSNPCFELWYFLHYEYSSGACNQDQMVDRLIKHIPDYTKAKKVFSELPGFAIAIQYASALREHHKNCGNRETDNPSTSVDALVQLLFSLKDSRCRQ